MGQPLKAFNFHQGTCPSTISWQEISVSGTTQKGAWGKWLMTLIPRVFKHSGDVRIAVETEKKHDKNFPSTPQNDEALMPLDDWSNAKLYVFIL